MYWVTVLMNCTLLMVGIKDEVIQMNGDCDVTLYMKYEQAFLFQTFSAELNHYVWVSSVKLLVLKTKPVYPNILPLCANISKTVGDTSKLLLRFRLALTLMTLKPEFS